MGRTNRQSWPLAIAALIALAGYAALVMAPMERSMGEIQRIFYFHAGSGMTALLAFTIVFVANVGYLVTRRRRWDWLAVSAAEVGVAFTTVVLVTGPIWAKPVWGIWWTWDARLTSTFLLWLLYIGYLVLRSLLAEPERRAMLAAVFGIFAYLDAPLVYFSIRLWRTQHPQPVILGGPGSGLDPAMKQVFLTCIVALVGVMILLIRDRYRLEAMREQVQELQLAAELRSDGGEPAGARQVLR